MQLYRGTGNDNVDNKNIGTYYTDCYDEAHFYGEEIEEIDINTSAFMVVIESDLEKYIADWLDGLDDDDRNYQLETKKYEYDQRAEILAANDAKSRGYHGVIISGITGETGCQCSYVIVF